MKCMERREFLKWAGVGVAAGVLPVWSGGEEAPAAGKPNVVLIISDDQGFTDYGFMGHAVVKTPNLDKLASQSVVFTRGYVTSALCCPSLTTMLTGLYPHEHRVTGNDPVQQDDRHLWYEAFEQCPRLPALLAQAGYVSFQSGKFWMGHYSRAGFTEGMTIKGRHGEAGLDIGRKTMQPVFDFIAKAQADQKPFFLWYAPMMPHLPHDAPQRFLEKYDAANPLSPYYAMCEWFDETCGQLLAFLDERKLSENTIIVFLSDNGWPETAKGSPYELGVRTPIMIRWPGHVAPRIDKDDLASNIDLVPTILAACGLKPAPRMPGLNLLDAAAVEKRHVIFGENFCHDMEDVTRPERSLRARTCIAGDWKLIRWQNPLPPRKTYNNVRKTKSDVELYNLREDPLETRDLADSLPDKVADLTKQLDAWWQPSR